MEESSVPADLKGTIGANFGCEFGSEIGLRPESPAVALRWPQAKHAIWTTLYLAVPLTKHSAYRPICKLTLLEHPDAKDSVFGKYQLHAVQICNTSKQYGPY